MAPTSKLALYLATLFLAYSLTPLSWVGGVVLVALTLIALLPAEGRARLASTYGRTIAVFVTSLFVLRILLEWAGRGTALDAPLLAPDGLIYPAARDAARVALLVLGAAIVQVTTRPRDFMRELELIRISRSGRLVVMMVVQYPRILQRRYAQIVEAQVARGGERPVTLRQRTTFALWLLLPLLQSELNALGDRAALIHTRRLDVETTLTESWRTTRSARDVLALTLAALVVGVGVAARIQGP